MNFDMRELDNSISFLKSGKDLNGQAEFSHTLKSLLNFNYVSLNILNDKKDVVKKISTSTDFPQTTESIIIKSVISTKSSKTFALENAYALPVFDKYNDDEVIAVLLVSKDYGIDEEKAVLNEIAVNLSASLSKKRLQDNLAKNTKNPIIGSSQEMKKVLELVDKVAAAHVTALILGESGTGKELIAKRIHENSERKTGPFVTINCGALQENLLESELFGHEKGAFTGAHTQKIGLAETANNGTLFLDEVGELTPQIQVKLLRFLNSGEIYRLGGKFPIHVNVRIVSATNRDLEKEIQNGRFREDLFYRLNTVSIKLPPLRERKNDVVELINYFLNNKNLGCDFKIDNIEPKAMDALASFSWPGNIRELQNTIERIKILSEDGIIKFSDIPLEIQNHLCEIGSSKELSAGENKSNIEAKAIALDLNSFFIERTLEEVEKMHIMALLKHHEGNKTRAAKSLGITIKTLYNKLEKYGMGNAVEGA